MKYNAAIVYEEQSRWFFYNNANAALATMYKVGAPTHG